MNIPACKPIIWRPWSPQNSTTAVQSSDDSPEIKLQSANMVSLSQMRAQGTCNRISNLPSHQPDHSGEGFSRAGTKSLVYTSKYKLGSGNCPLHASNNLSTGNTSGKVDCQSSTTDLRGTITDGHASFRSPWACIAPRYMPSRVITRTTLDRPWYIHRPPIPRFKSRPSILQLKTSNVKEIKWAENFEGVKYCIWYSIDAMSSEVRIASGSTTHLLTAGDHIIVDNFSSNFIYELARIRVHDVAGEFIVDVFAFDREGNHIAEASHVMEPFVINIPSIYIDPLAFYVTPERPPLPL